MNTLFVCIGIFFARICDVTLGTIRTFMSVKGKPIVAGIIGFFEVTVWFLVARNALSNNASAFIVIAYAGGYGAGTIIGGILAKKMLHEKLGIRITINSDQKELINILREVGYAISVTQVKGYKNETKYMLFMEIDDKELSIVEDIVKDFDENIFMVVSETRHVSNGFFKNVVK